MIKLCTWKLWGEPDCDYTIAFYSQRIGQTHIHKNIHFLALIVQALVLINVGSPKLKLIDTYNVS